MSVLKKNFCNRVGTCLFLLSSMLVQTICFGNSIGYSPSDGFELRGASPIPEFSVNNRHTCTGQVVFTDLSASNPTTWKWYFGDGDSSSLRNPSHTYLQNGTYSVTLKASNVDGDSSVTKTDYIFVNRTGGITKAINCSPTTQNGTFGFGITRFSLNTISNTSSNSSEGYRDFTCMNTSVYAGADYSISAVTATPAAHNIRVWIDYDDNGQFHSSNELVYSADSVLSFSGIIRIPENAVKNTALRLRISADYFLSPYPGPCTNLQYGQAEDYAITILDNPHPPIANFSANKSVTCDGMIAFTDLSLNAPTQWLWDFGDGNVSLQKNPSYTYTASGVYTVRLRVSKGADADSIAKVDFVTVNLNNAITNASCSPLTLNYCCSYGIYEVKFNGINKLSGNAAEGYKDFSCDNYTEVIEGTTHQLTVKVGTANTQDTKVWIDYNDDGVFTANELVLSRLNFANVVANINIPLGGIFDKVLRMRISSDYSGSDPGPCSNLMYGQTEDYGIIVRSLNIGPTAGFTSNKVYACDGVVQFSDASSGSPTEWLWNFGDGESSSSQSPDHTYASSGLYSVSLKVSNTFGENTLVKTNYITVDKTVLCDTVYMPVMGGATIQTACAGLITDDGGNGKNYSDNVNGLIIINPPSVGLISLEFKSFQLEENFDRLSIYKGTDLTGQLIGTFSGNDLNGATVNVNGPVTLHFISDGATNYSGFFIEWNCSVAIENLTTSKIEDVVLYPIPASSFLNINFDVQESDPLFYELRSIDGSLKEKGRLNGSGNHYSLDISNKADGVYFLFMNTSNGMLSKKLIIQH